MTRVQSLVGRDLHNNNPPMASPDTISAGQNATTTRARLLLVAGPSGAGKSTFLAQLRQRTLPASIQSEFGTFADAGTALEVTNELRRRIERSGISSAEAFGASDLLVVHYDITSIYRFAIDGYEADPGLEVLGLGDDIQIVTILPSQQQLLAQFASRARSRQRAKGLLRMAWKELVRTPLRRARLAFGIRSPRLEQDLYRDSQWVAQCYAQWQAYVAAAVAQKPSTRVLYVEPCSSNGAPSFRCMA